MFNSINLLNLIFYIGVIFADSPCGEWAVYRDEKCFKVFDWVVPFSGAAQICAKEKATIGVIKSAEIQDLVFNDLKNQSIADSVWIGIKKRDNSFRTLDGLPIKYTNWANGRPLNQTDVECVEVNDDYQGKWVDVKCEKRNAVLCEKNQEWSSSKIEDVLQEIRKNYSVKLDLQEQTLSKHLGLIEAQRKELEQFKQDQANKHNQIDAQRKELEQYKQNQANQYNQVQGQINGLAQTTVPVGFIYIQLAGQSDPHALWPQTSWNHITPNYAGLFFRAEGAGSSGFGQIQEQQIQSIDIQNDICTGRCIYDLKNPWRLESSFPGAGFWTGWNGGGGDALGLKFRHNNEEIRPRNQAVHIWIRIK